jgi:hypothetical protein
MASNIPPSRILNFLHKLFDVKAGQTVPQYSALLGRSHSDPFNYGQTQYSEDRLAKMREYDAMDLSSSECYVALNTYAEESTQYSLDKKRTIWITSDNDKIVSELHSFFDEFDIEEKLFGLTRHICKYGEAFLFPVIDGQAGVQDAIVPHPSLVKIRFDENDYNKVVGYDCEALDIIQPSELGYENPPMPKDIQVRSSEGFSPWDWVHFRIKGSDLASHYGSSMLEGGRRIWKTLAMLETAVALYRINKAGNRLLFKVGTGTANPSESNRIVEEYIKSIRQTPFLSIKDPGRGGDGTLEDFLMRYKQNQFMEDIFFPMPTGSESSVEVLDIPMDLGALEDLEYWKTKYRTSYGIPKAYFDGDISGWGANKALAQQDVQFARKMERIQKAIIGGMNILCGLHLIYKGFTKFSFTVHMEPPSALGLLQRLEVQKVKLDQAIEFVSAADTFGVDKVKWTVKALSEIMDMSKDEIKELMVRIPQPTQLPPGALPQTVGGQMGGIDDPSLGGAGAPIGGDMAAEPPVQSTLGTTESFVDLVESLFAARNGKADDGLVTQSNFKEFVESGNMQPLSVRSLRSVTGAKEREDQVGS